MQVAEDSLETLHARASIDSGSVATDFAVCGAVVTGTLIQLAWWGSPDRKWCRKCAAMLKRAGMLETKPSRKAKR